MLTADECIPYVVAGAQTLGSSGIGTVTGLSTDDSVHQNGQEGGPVVADTTTQVDFDEFARCYGNRHGIAVPASCDALSRSVENGRRFFFVEYKGGNIVAHDQKTDALSIRKKFADDIEKKLYDSALMLVKEQVVNLNILRQSFVVLVVVRDDRIPRTRNDGNPAVSENPVLCHLRRAALEFKLRSMTGLAETLYLDVKIVSADTFRSLYLPHFELVRLVRDDGQAEA